MPDRMTESTMAQFEPQQASGARGARLSEVHPLLGEPLWESFVRWVRLRGSLDTYKLAHHIQRQMMLRSRGSLITEESPDGLLDSREIFSRMMVLLAVFDAAIPSPSNREDLMGLAGQICRLFSLEWKNLTHEINDRAVETLKNTVRDLLKEPEFRTPPNVVIGNLRPRLIGTRSLDEVPPQREVISSGRPAVGLPLYKTTLLASSRARMGDFNLRFELDSLPAKDREEKLAAAKAAADQRSHDAAAHSAAAPPTAAVAGAL